MLGYRGRSYHGPERRHWPRHRLTCLKVRYKKPILWMFRTGESPPCDVSNVNSHGVRFYTAKKLRRGKHLDVHFDAPAGVYRIAGDNHLTAKVMWQKWSKSHGCWRTGASFIHVSKTTHEDLARMMKDAALHSPGF